MRLIILIIVLLGIDQWTKELVAGSMSEGDTIGILNDFFHITYVKNHGVAFGMFQGEIKTISIVAIIAILGIIYFMIKQLKPHEVISKYAYAFILAGAIGNMIDRIYRGFVIDFADFRGIWKFVFNMADVWINIGVFLLVLEVIILEKRKKQIKKRN
ncbi:MULTISPECIES: signal peptidase II [Psychrilyobacter]|uniref:Lipoprotein signal peptidase n=1 Tax=Psychrilyobacter piezotolerans TaxID=2293438 RepID=A0ABX9KKZ9_9FUSO|nr:MULTISPECIES: signal peptidase II [Psychrilyobacter]MCS5421631.1 signal peptidase II [Psychrilyobacter sp. S5]NDI76674.1 signal peptidase II [Psychrilyobacter piezotolerans]RDE65298.1 signal peptidase II [Psychrilyobacter sp. S5]REI42916.1 signal peptidase II [Psychrilyobacter piezotolerans]